MERLAHGAVTHYIVTLSLSLSLSLFLLFIFHSLFLSLSSLLLFFSYSIFLSLTVSRYFSLSCSSIDLSFYYSSTAISVYSSVSCSSRILSFFLFLSLSVYTSFIHLFVVDLFCSHSLPVIWSKNYPAQGPFST